MKGGFFMAILSRTASRKREPYRSVKAFMQKKDLGQKDFGELLGKSQSSINQKLNGTGGDFTLSEVRLLHQKFGVPMDYFFEISVPFKERKEG